MKKFYHEEHEEKTDKSKKEEVGGREKSSVRSKILVAG
jgi:hypothetical protein